MWQNMRTYQIIADNPIAHFNAELLLVSRMDLNMKILLFSLVLVVNIHDAVFTETFITCKEHR
jgi:hypothetical protein